VSGRGDSARMRNLIAGSYTSKRDWLSLRQEGDRRRRAPGKDPTKDELVIQEQPLGSQRHSGKSMSTLDQEPTATKRSINPSGQVEGGQRGEVAVDILPVLVIVNKGELADPKKIKICPKFGRCVLWPPKVVDEAKKVQEEDRSSPSK